MHIVKGYEVWSYDKDLLMSLKRRYGHLNKDYEKPKTRCQEIRLKLARFLEHPRYEVGVCILSLV
jgi:hypothetical protein